MDLSCTVSPSETRATTWGRAFGSSLVGAGGVGDDGLIELLAEFAAGLGDAALGLLAKLRGGGAILHGGDGLAGVVLEIAHEGVQLLLQVADFIALLLEAFGFEATALAGYLLLALTQVEALGFNLAKIGVELVEEAGDVLRLGAEAAARVGDDLRLRPICCAMLIPAEAPGTPTRSSIGGRESFLIEADSRVEDSGRVGGVNLERGVMGGDDGERAGAGGSARRWRRRGRLPLRDRWRSLARRAGRASGRWRCAR